MNRTKTIITDAFLQLLEEKPYNKITVKDITDYCQINRNTFYYHFHSIPDVLEKIIKKETDYFIKKYSQFNTPIECLLPIVKYCSKRKKMILHIYHSLQREIFINQLERASLYAVTQYIDKVTEKLTIPSIDKKLLIRFYKCALVGITLDWLEEEMNYDLLESLTRIETLFSGSSKQAFLKSAESLQE